MAELNEREDLYGCLDWSDCRSGRFSSARDAFVERAARAQAQARAKRGGPRLTITPERLENRFTAAKPMFEITSLQGKIDQRTLHHWLSHAWSRGLPRSMRCVPLGWSSEACARLPSRTYLEPGPRASQSGSFPNAGPLRACSGPPRLWSFIDRLAPLAWSRDAPLAALDLFFFLLDRSR